MISIKRKGLLYHFLQRYGCCMDRTKYGLESTFPTNTCILLIRILFGVFMVICFTISLSVLTFLFIHPFVLLVIVILYDTNLSILLADVGDIVLFVVSMIAWTFISYLFYEKMEYKITQHLPFIITIKNKIKQLCCGQVAYKDN